MGPMILIYSGIIYAVFFGAFVYLIAFTGGEMTSYFGAPKTLDAGTSSFGGAGAFLNIGLLLLFGLQHSVMARPGFKKIWTKIIPEPMERSTYVLATVIVLLILYYGWQPMPAVIWSISSPLWSGAMMALFFAGFGIVFLSTFLINHFELFGLSQAWRKFKVQKPAAGKFQTPLLYRFIRHPLYLGFLIAFWSTSYMTAGHLLFAGVWSVYIFIGIGYEERDLVDHLGEPYRDYLRKVPMILPFGRRK